MAATLSEAPVTYYFFFMVVMHLLTPNVYIGGRIINEANGIGNLVSLTPYSGLNEFPFGNSSPCQHPPFWILLDRLFDISSKAISQLCINVSVG